MPATGEVVLDTSAAVAHLRGVQPVSAQLAQFERLYLPTVALGELLYGIRRSARSRENLDQLKNWLRAVTLLSLSQQTAEHYSAIKDGLARAGSPIPENDIWIAAHAVEQQLPLFCLDAHFNQIAGLSRVTL